MCPSKEILALHAALEKGARGIRATHPEVAANRALLSLQAIAEMPPEAVEELRAAEPVLTAISVPALAEDWVEDIATIVARQTGPVQVRRILGSAERNPGLAGYDAEVRLFSRAAKIAVLLRKAPDPIPRIDRSAGYKGAQIVTNVAALVRWGVDLFHFFF